MDRLGGFEREEDDIAVDGDETDADMPVAIGSDERRLHVRAYNYWVSLLGDQSYPSVEDLDPSALEEFGPNSVLLDFTTGIENPGVSWLGRALREECGLGHGITSIADVPGRSLLSRLTDHYLQIIANRAPVGFEAEFVNLRGHQTLYRGILMPFSSDDESIDFIFGVISWKEMADSALADGLAAEMAGLADIATPAAPPPTAGSEPDELPLAELCAGLVERSEAAGQTTPEIDLETTLADAQALARNAHVQEGRGRAALYQALGRAHDFALAARRAPGEFDRLVARAGLTVQERAPFTPVVKLVFGLDYDKTRLTEYAAALSYARRRGVLQGELPGFVEQFAGGLKGVVAAERRHRMPGVDGDPVELARAKLRDVEPCATLQLQTAGDEFVLLLARRERDGSLAVLAPLEGDRALVDRAVRSVAR